MRKLFLLILGLLMMSSVALAAEAEDAVVIQTFVIEVSDSGKEELKTWSQGKASFCTVLSHMQIDLDKIGKLVLQDAAKVDLGQQVQKRQEQLPIVLKAKGHDIIIGGCDNGMKLNLQYDAHNGDKAKVTSDILFLNSSNVQEKSKVAVPDFKGQYLTIEQELPFGDGIIAGGFQSFGSLSGEEKKEYVVVQLVGKYDPAAAQAAQQQAAQQQAAEED